MATKLADDYAAIAARLREIEREQAEAEAQRADEPAEPGE